MYADVKWHDEFYRFLQNIYRIYPEDRFHTLIKEGLRRAREDEAIYRTCSAGCPRIKPFLAELTYALPSLAKQKQEMARQTLELLGERRDFDGYVEIGIDRPLCERAAQAPAFRDRSCWSTTWRPTWSPVDIVERGQLAQARQLGAARRLCADSRDGGAGRERRTS